MAMEKEIPISDGLCALRWKCENVNEKCCKPIPEGDGCVHCENFKENIENHTLIKEKQIKLGGKTNV